MGWILGKWISFLYGGTGSVSNKNFWDGLRGVEPCHMHGLPCHMHGLSACTQRHILADELQCSYEEETVYILWLLDFSLFQMHHWLEYRKTDPILNALSSCKRLPSCRKYEGCLTKMNFRSRDTVKLGTELCSEDWRTWRVKDKKTRHYCLSYLGLVSWFWWGVIILASVSIFPPTWKCPHFGQMLLCFHLENEQSGLGDFWCLWGQFYSCECWHWSTLLERTGNLSSLWDLGGKWLSDWVNGLFSQMMPGAGPQICEGQVTSVWFAILLASGSSPSNKPTWNPSSAPATLIYTSEDEADRRGRGNDEIYSQGLFQRSRIVVQDFE